MLGSSAKAKGETNSFIPKQRGAVRRKKSSGKKKLFLLTIVTYVVLFASLLSAGAMFLYHNYEKSKLEREVVGLNAAITTFNSEDLESVQEIDLKLRQANDRMLNAASVVAVLDAVDLATAESVQFQNISIERIGDEKFTISGDVVSSSFDAAIFQRAIYKLNKRLFSKIETEEVSLSRTQTEGQSEGQRPQIVTEVNFSVSLEVPLEAVPYTFDETKEIDDDLEPEPELQVEAVEPTSVVEQDELTIEGAASSSASSTVNELNI